MTNRQRMRAPRRRRQMFAATKTDFEPKSIRFPGKQS